MQGPFEQSEATAARRRVYFFLVDATDGKTPETGEAAGQPQISIAGASWTNTTGTLVAVGNGSYYVELSTIELGTLGVYSIRYKSANTCEFQDCFYVIPTDPYTNWSTFSSGVNAVTLTLHDEVAADVPGVLCVVRSTDEATEYAHGVTATDGTCGFNLDDGSYNVRYGGNAQGNKYIFSNPYSLTVSGVTTATYTCTNAATVTLGGLTFGQLRGEFDLHLLRWYPDAARYVTGDLRDKWLNAAYYELDRVLRWTRTYTDVTMVSSTQNYTKPDTVREILTAEIIWDTSYYYPIERIDIKEFVAKRTSLDADGRPTHYALNGNQFWMYPTPDASGTLRLWTLTDPAELANESDKPTFSPHVHEKIVDLALTYAMRYMGQVDKAVEYRNALLGQITIERSDPGVDRGNPGRIVNTGL